MHGRPRDRPGRPGGGARARLPVAAVACGLALLATTASDARADPASAPRSEDIASYQIEARLFPETKLIQGKQRVRWRNTRERPTRELWFHLYWNAWRNDRSTWMLGDRIRGRSDRGSNVRAEDWSYQRVRAARLLPDGDDLMPTLEYRAPDDGNEHDRTVMVLELPEEVGPGEEVELELEWESKVPRTFARTGYRGDFYFVAHWFPQLGVYEPSGWNCHQFHAATEFYADYGAYDVAITLPEHFVVGATGKLESRVEAEGLSTHRYRQRDVHGFAWTASPDYVESTHRFEVSGLPPVDLRLLMQPEHEAQADRHLAATYAALEHYGKWFGPYPYETLTVVDPAFGSGAGGMEYPTLFTCGTTLFNPFGSGSPEAVTVHEAGHQFFYGVVGNNEFEHAWIDEGINSFAEARVQDVVWGKWVDRERYFRPPGIRTRGFFPVLFPELELSRWVHGNNLPRYRMTPSADEMSRPTFLYFPRTAGRLSYDKTALWLSTLERHLGWETLREILSTFYRRYSFRHATPDDFFTVANEVSGQDLGWFFDQVYRGSEAFDYGVESVSSSEIETSGYVEGEADGALELVDSMRSGEKLYRTEVVVRRHGGGIFPVDVLLVFEDGTEVRRPWDGRYRWTSIAVDHPSRLRYAEVDPDRVLVLDVDWTNNSRLLTPASRLASVKWSSKWLVWLQDYMHTAAYFL